jgi:alkanesulfonate monooxygenase SsuD/methylene tetrahydromethanopterin reductase-like flavin-dependent oxidoreductase (luciferase family)
MDYSVWIPGDLSWEDALDLARMADDGPWRTLWYADHYMPNTGTEEVADGDTYEAWTMLPAFAAATERVRLGPLVSPTSIHHPALLANRAATLDRISNGRFVLGLGAGWQINEHNAYGIELEKPGDRVARFEEAIEVTRSLLDNERTTFSGRFYEFTDAPCQPTPVQDKLPIAVGTGGPRMLRATARFAQEWNTWGAPEMASGAMEKYRAACEAVGTDPASLHTSVQALVFMSEDAERLEKWRSKADPDRSIIGTPAEVAETVNGYADLGFDEFILLGMTLGATPTQRREAYEQFAAVVGA